MPNGAPRVVVRNIDAVVQLEEEFLSQRTMADRLSDAIAAFVGSIRFVILHVVWFVAWVVINFRVIPAIPAFDPYPFQLLCMMVSLEAVLLSTFVLIKQNRMSHRADQRSHLDLQVNLLSEKEVTKLIQMQRLICQKLGVSEAEKDEEMDEMSETTAVERLARELKSKIPPSE
jgi:uncharacterized membrane protein